MVSTEGPSRILIADGDPVRRQRVVDLLRREGCSCEVVTDALQALGLAISERFELVVVGADLPRSDVETLDRLGALQPRAGLVLLSSRPVSKVGREQVVGRPEEVVGALRQRRGRTTRRRRRPPPKPVRDQPLAGALSPGLPLELCRILHSARQSGALELKGPDRCGMLGWVEGELVDARIRAEGGTVATGQRALRQALQLGRGSYLFKRIVIPPRCRTITQPTPVLLDQVTHEPGTQRRPPRRRAIGPFELLQPLARSRRRDVYRARWRTRETGTESAAGVVRLVLLRPPIPIFPVPLERIQAFRDSRVASLVGHGWVGEERWIASELPRGPTLREVVDRMGRLPRSRVAAIFPDVFRTLELIHHQDLVHGGLDANRIVALPGRPPKLLALGLQDPRDLPLTTLKTTAPELLKGGAPTPASDLYAAGVLLFYALTRKYPFDAQDPSTVADAHRYDEPQTLAGLGSGGTEGLDVLLARLLAKSPEDRLDRGGLAAELLDDALGVEDDQPTCAKAGPISFRDDPAREKWTPAGFEISHLLGVGGMGEVYAARHQVLDKDVAIKVLRAGDTQDKLRFVREARLTTRIDHPNVVKVLDAGEQDGRLYLVMELVVGESVKARLRREGALEQEEVLAITRQVLMALDAAHALGVLHRDVKPANILADGAGRVKLVDFGLARTAESAQITLPGEVLGTPSFMAPEQCLGEECSPATDLYGVGATIFTMLTGRPLFRADSPMEIVQLQLYEPPPRLENLVAGISPALSGLAQRLLAKRPEERYASAAQVLEVLRDL